MWFEIVLDKMKLETKRELLKWTDSYWYVLPKEMRDLILEYRESQEFIDRRESVSNRALCRQIRMYGLLRQKWQIGHIQCRVLRCNRDVRCDCMRVYGWYRTLRGEIQKRYLGISLEHAMDYCDFRRASFLNGDDYDWVLIGVVRASVH